MSSRPDTLHDAVIIGAGLAGLAVAAELRKRGVAVRLLEGARRVAEPWRRRYAGLHLNTHRCLSHLPGRTMSRRAGPFPGRNAVIRYLENYPRDIGTPGPGASEASGRVAARARRFGPGPRCSGISGVRGTARAHLRP